MLAGCGSEPSNNPAPAGPVHEVLQSTGNKWSDQLASKPVAEQKVLLASVVRGVGDKCPSIDRLEYKGQHEGQAFWAVDCSSAPDQMVAIASDSSTSVLSCATMKTVGKKDDCWTKW